MVDHLVSEKIVPADLRSDVLNALEEREAKMSTAIGKELAIPHASIHDLPQVIKLLARSDGGIAAAASDELPVRFFYLSLIPDNDYSSHLRTIASISSFFRDEDHMKNLKSAANEAELKNVFSTATS
jgi:mannitol/fructose-specific phosphotransferase system IIA component (Ntr-type)